MTFHVGFLRAIVRIKIFLRSSDCEPYLFPLSLLAGSLLGGLDLPLPGVGSIMLKCDVAFPFLAARKSRTEAGRECSPDVEELQGRGRN